MSEGGRGEGESLPLLGWPLSPWVGGVEDGG